MTIHVFMGLMGVLIFGGSLFILIANSIRRQSLKLASSGLLLGALMVLVGVNILTPNQTSNGNASATDSIKSVGHLVTKEYLNHSTQNGDTTSSNYNQSNETMSSTSNQNTQSWAINNSNKQPYNSPNQPAFQPWTKLLDQTTSYEWKQMSQEQRVELINRVYNNFIANGGKINQNPQFIFNAVDRFYTSATGSQADITLDNLLADLILDGASKK